MVHLTLQLGASIVVPFGTLRRKSTDTPQWKVRSLRKAFAIDAALVIGPWRFGRSAAFLQLGSAAARRRHFLDRNEV